MTNRKLITDAQVIDSVELFVTELKENLSPHFPGRTLVTQDEVAELYFSFMKSMSTGPVEIMWNRHHVPIIHSTLHTALSREFVNLGEFSAART